MNQNYNSLLNPLEKHFQSQAVINKRDNTLAYIAIFTVGAVIGIFVDRWIKSQRDEEYDFEFPEKNE
ncbi:hypothetical protein LCGC14_2858510 [marine sediment metagenome]|uniref:Uncharacterized protein n=1 Tax=marine sediment metagenome TaxID=412755 RepID=A0A0F9AES9_9ZZZZ